MATTNRPPSSTETNLRWSCLFTPLRLPWVSLSKREIESPQIRGKQGIPALKIKITLAKSAHECIRVYVTLRMTSQSIERSTYFGFRLYRANLAWASILKPKRFVQVAI